MKYLMIVGWFFASGFVFPAEEFTFSDKDKVSALTSQANRLDDATGTSEIGGVESKFVVESDTNKDTAHVRFSRIIGNKFKGDLRISTPFNQDKNASSELLNFSGLSNATSLTLGLSYNSFDPFQSASGLTRTEIDDLRRPICEKYADARNMSLDDDFDSECDNTIFQDDDLGRHFLNSYWKSVDGVPNYWVAGMNATYGTEGFKYVEATDLTNSISDNKEQSSISAYYALVRGNAVTSFSYISESTYSISGKKQLCQDFGLGTTECREISVGAPTKSTSDLFSIEHRMRFRNSIFAISPKITHDFDMSETQVELPIYFLRSSSLNLNGGFVISWDTMSKEISSSFFVGKSFSFLN